MPVKQKCLHSYVFLEWVFVENSWCEIKYLS